MTESVTSTSTPASNKTPTIAAGVAAGIGGFILGGIAAALFFLFFNRPQKKKSNEPESQDVRISVPYAPHARISDGRERPPPLGTPPELTGESGSTTSNTWNTAEAAEASGSSGSVPQLIARWQGRTRTQNVEGGEGYQGPRRIATLDFRNIRS